MHCNGKTTAIQHAVRRGGLTVYAAAYAARLLSLLQGIRPSEAVNHKIPHEILRLMQKETNSLCFTVGTTDACVAGSFVFTRPFSNQRVRNFRLLLITQERFSLAA